MRICSLFVALLALGTAVAQAQQQQPQRPVHLFILSGQSNMAGMNPKLGFEPEAAALFPDADVKYIKVARGGQPIRYWVEQWNAIAARHGVDVQAKRQRDRQQETMFYQPILDQFRKLLAEHPEPASVTFCWMQGERDAREELSAPYGDSLKQLITNLRRDLEQPKMQVVIARLSDFGKPDQAHWQAIRKTQVELADSDPLGAWVDCDDLNDKPQGDSTRNDLHYTKAGYELLGRRYVRQAKALIEGRTPAANGRPTTAEGDRTP